ncbi:hypothetical protein ACGFOU_33225 [Streptomyces sp. NPDC048595]|uniref:hypothetical protein n=1 Tax=Streptomyces sp. NPDC048595 TaxID=3365576 RepID=UPI00371CD2AE
MRIDAAARTARVAAGVVWGQVSEAAAPYGFAPLNGSSPGVGVVSCTLGAGPACWPAPTASPPTTYGPSTWSPPTPGGCTSPPSAAAAPGREPAAAAVSRDG